MLANRLGPCLNTIIPTEQTAFLPGRHIGDNIMFLQLLPALLRDEHRNAVIAFLDFAKAFDTIDRSFLFSCLEALGLGDGFLHWVRILLTDTFARAIINGFPSARAAFLAGVRQGCPLAPLIYLCLALALQCWLLHHGIGLPIGRQFCTGTKFADDTTALLRSLDPACVQQFLDVMAVFGRASGQHLNLDKCQLLPVGVPLPSPPPPTVAGIAVCTVATAMGIAFSNGPAPDTLQQPDVWAARLSTVEKCFTKLTKLHLSAFGRGFSSAAYGLSQVLYHAEFDGIPPDVASHLSRITTKLVDRNRAPASAQPALPGIQSILLSGNPKIGGFGCLSWQQHILSRHAVWGARLICALAAGLSPTSPPWVVVAHTLLTRLGRTCFGPADLATPPAIHPALALLSASRCPSTFHIFGGSRPLPPGPLRRMALGLGAISAAAGPPTDIDDDPLVLGPWCRSMPLWGNPLLPAPAGVVDGCGGPGSCLEDVFGDLQVIPSLRTIGDVVRIHASLLAALAACRQAGLEGEGRRQECFRRVWGPELLRANWPRERPPPGPMQLLLNDYSHVLQRLTALLPALPPAWLAPSPVGLQLATAPASPPSSPAAAAAAAPSAAAAAAAAAAPAAAAAAPSAAAAPGPAAAALQLITSRLGWRLPGPLGVVRPSRPCNVTLDALLVRTGTALQLQPTLVARHAAHCSYVSLALEPGVSPAALAAGQGALAATLLGGWRLKWDNAQKEVLWRLAVDGIASANSRTAWQCPCCPHLDASPRLHCFWNCPIACAVRAELSRALQHVTAQPIGRASVWLGQPPPTRLSTPVAG